MKTKVSVIQTTIKYYDAVNDNVQSVKVAGGLNITECKNYLKENELGTFIQKENIKESFDVDTVQLLLLKEV